MCSLIPNLSYVSEAAAYVLDLHLRTNLVPYTAVVNLSSKSFHYPYLARRAFYRKKKPFPAKPGSFQVFLKGFKDANVFLRENPWPDQYWAGFRGDSNGRRRKKKTWTESCRPSTSGTVDLEAGQNDDYESDDETEDGEERFRWTDGLKQSFREELEKLVILDYIMRNTDRGLDNWMVKVDWETGQVSIASDPVRLNMNTEGLETQDEPRPRPVDAENLPTMPATASYPYTKQRPMQAASGSRSREPAMALGAIDNSLSWPWKHPDAWRRYVVPRSRFYVTFSNPCTVIRSGGFSCPSISSADRFRKKHATISSRSSLPQPGGARPKRRSSASSRLTKTSRNACLPSRLPS